MFTRSMNGRARRVTPGVEQLEDRQLLSISVTPSVINLKNLSPTAKVTVTLISDDANSRFLLGEIQNVMITASSGGATINLTGREVKQRLKDVNGDRIPDAIAVFRRSILKSLPAGLATVKVTDGIVSETGTFVVIRPGRPGPHVHHGHPGATH